MVIDKLCARLRVLYYRILKITGGTISVSCYIGKKVHMEGKNSIGTRTYLQNVDLGYGTYIANESNLTSCKIGRYCSIGSNVRRIAGTHPTRNFVSTHPAFFSTNHLTKLCYVNRQKFQEVKYSREEPYCILIGNDVWIGSNVSIVDGVEIGDGAIIAAGAVVTKDVEPYSVVGGVPAKFIRKRFTDEQIEKLLALEWWNQSENWIRKKAEYFEDVSSFFDHVSN